MPTEPFSASIALKHGLIAIFGGIVHALQSYREGDAHGPLDIIILSIISAFTGVIFAFVTLNIYPDSYITYAAAGVGGFIGIEGMSWLTNYIKRKIK